MITVVVASKNRPQHLMALLDSLQKQTNIPTEVVIVDASDNFAKIEDSDLPFKLRHISTKDSSISRQRNLGMLQVISQSKYVSILDDDTYPEEKYFEKIIGFLDANEQVIGASGITFPPTDDLSNSKFVKWFKYLFFLDSRQSGVITRGGINVGLRTNSLEPLKVEWLIGCSVFRVSSLQNLTYEESFDGYSLGEDVLFSYIAGEHGDLFVLPDVRINHLEVSKSTHYQAEYWYKWAKNRRPLIALMPGVVFKWLPYLWSNLGQILIVLHNPKIEFRVRLKSASRIIKGSSRVG